MTAGYYRFPTIHGETVVFVSEDDLWSVAVGGGVARRLTSNLGEVSYPMLSPDGAQVAFVGREEGAAEVYVMPAAGGPAQRLTYLHSNCRVVGWSPDGASILFCSNHGQPMPAEMGLFAVRADRSNGQVTPLPYGAARAVAFGPQGGVVIGRNTGDPARWKRYRGGTAGHLWVDVTGNGEFTRLLPEVAGNIASPMWLVSAGEPAGRIYFVSDHEGVGNLYSCRPNGEDVRRHTDHADYYVRNPASDGQRIVYHGGADLFVYSPADDTTQRVDLAYHSPRVQRNRKFADAGRYLDGYGLHPSGQGLAITTRGKAYTFFNHEGPVVQFGKREGVRYRQPTWLADGRRLLLVSDEPGEETLEIYDGRPNRAPERLDGLDIGRVVAIKVSPVEDKVALTNHRHELLLVDLRTRTLEVVDRSLYVNIAGFDWSPDGRWLAYSLGATSRTSELRLYHLPDEEAPADSSTDAPGDTPTDPATDAATVGDPGADPAALPLTARGSRHVITQPVLHDVRPAFDPTGKYLYFLSYREFNPVYDGLHFDLGFPWGMRPYLITLRADLRNPFIPVPDMLQEEEDEDDDHEDDAEHEDDGEAAGQGAEDESAAAEDEEPLDDAEGDEEGDEDGEAEDEGEEGDEGDDADETDFRGRPKPARTAQFHAEAAGAAAPPERPAESGEARRPSRPRHGPKPLRIDLEGIAQRVLAFPVPDGRYGQIAGIPHKAIFTVLPIQGQLDEGYDWEDEQEESGSLRAYDFKEYKSESLAENVVSFEISANQKKLLYAGRGQLRVIPAGEKAPGGGGYTRKGGWINLNRVRVSVDPQREWEQMFREAWRLQRDHFWTADMAEVDWHTVYHRYFALIERISTRGEFSDLLWEMQGELGTSHAYEFGGDYRPRPFYGQGFLGADLTWDAAAGGYRVGEPLLGDGWDPEANSPLAAPGVRIKPGDLLVAINGQMLDADTGPAQLLVNQAGNEVLLTYLPAEAHTPETPPAEAAQDGETEETAAVLLTDVGVTEEPTGQDATDADDAPVGDAGEHADEDEDDGLRGTVVKVIGSEAPARYRHWVNGNRRTVHAATDGRVGYIHVPDMSPAGYAEFHRGYLAELDRDALIIDVRYNGGGHVSQLILEKLARRRLGYDLSRWGGLVPYPVEAVAGPLVALTNEHAGSDGDIFCHSFKMMKLGPLVGKRTWGGVIGIAPRHALVDGTVTTQPEYSFWFEDVGWGVENYGTEPDIDVDITPQDYRAGTDPQLARAIAEALRLLAENPRKVPELTSKPSRALPKLPPRTPAR